MQSYSSPKGYPGPCHAQGCQMKTFSAPARNSDRRSSSSGNARSRLQSESRAWPTPISQSGHAQGSIRSGAPG
jgi:hypothetical protein